LQYRRHPQDLCLIRPAFVASDVTSPAPNPQRPSLWERLHRAVDFGSYCPGVRPDLKWREFTSVNGEYYVVVQNPRTHTYRRLTAEDFFLFKLMDGSRSVQQLVVAYMVEFHRISLQGIAQLVQDLRDRQMLDDPAYETYERLARLTGSRSLIDRMRGLLAVCLNHEYPVNEVDGLVTRVYRVVGRPLFCAPGTIILALIAAIGVPLLVWHVLKANLLRSPGISPLETMAVVALSLLAVTAIHESAHALTVKSYGRSVTRGGFAILNGFPGLFVDTQDIWMEPRYARIAVSWAGPYSGFVLAGLSGILLTFSPPGTASTFLQIFGLVALAGNSIQLLPLVRLDGYYMLMDCLDIPNLRARSLMFIRHDLWSRVVQRRTLSKEERILAVFGFSALAYSAVLSLLIAWFLLAHAKNAFHMLQHAHTVAGILAFVFVVAIVAPFVAGMLAALCQTGRSLLNASLHLSGAAKERWYRRRVTLIAQVPCLARLGDAAVRALAPRLKEERPMAGETIVRQGEAGDRFYLIVDGRAGVYLEDSAGSSHLAELGPLDYFGERALIERAPRAASVRAESDMRLLSLGAKQFRNSIKDYVAEDVDIRAGFEQLAEMDQFPLLQPLGSRERQVLLRYLHAETYRKGDTIVRENEPGDTFYLLRSGEVRVSRQGSLGEELELQTLSAGDFFGEIALLTDLPRIATVRALGDARTWTLDRQAFQNLLGQYFNLGDRLMPVARERLIGDQVVATGGDDTPGGVELGVAAPELASEPNGGGVSLVGYHGRRIALWFSRDCADSPANVTVAISRLNALGTVVVRVVPDQMEYGTNASGVSGPYIVHPDPSRRSYSSYGMFTGVPRAQPESDSHWNAVMSQLSSELYSRTDLYEIHEGVAIVDSSGRVELLKLVGGADELALVLIDASDIPY
jgi:CRP-like cAMP-binding protein